MYLPRYLTLPIGLHLQKYHVSICRTPLPQYKTAIGYTSQDIKIKPEIAVAIYRFYYFPKEIAPRSSALILLTNILPSLYLENE